MSSFLTVLFVVAALWVAIDGVRQKKSLPVAAQTEGARLEGVSTAEGANLLGTVMEAAARGGKADRTEGAAGQPQLGAEESRESLLQMLPGGIETKLRDLIDTTDKRMEKFEEVEE